MRSSFPKYTPIRASLRPRPLSSTQPIAFCLPGGGGRKGGRGVDRSEGGGGGGGLPSDGESEKISSPLSWEVSSLDSSEDRLDESPSDDESLMRMLCGVFQMIF